MRPENGVTRCPKDCPSRKVGCHNVNTCEAWRRQVEENRARLAARDEKNHVKAKDMGTERDQGMTWKWAVVIVLAVLTALWIVWGMLKAVNGIWFEIEVLIRNTREI